MYLFSYNLFEGSCPGIEMEGMFSNYCADNTARMPAVTHQSKTQHSMRGSSDPLELQFTRSPACPLTLVVFT